MLKLTYRDLQPHILRSGRKRDVGVSEDTITITPTTQGRYVNPGININFRIKDFLEFVYFEVAAIGNRLYFRPTNNGDDTYKLSVNSTAFYPVGKIGKEQFYSILLQFEGTWDAHRCQIDGLMFYYIER